MPYDGIIFDKEEKYEMLKKQFGGIIVATILSAGQVYALEGFSFRQSYEENITPQISTKTASALSSGGAGDAAISTFSLAPGATPPVLNDAQKELIKVTNEAVSADSADDENAKSLRELKFGSAVKFVNGATNTSVVPVVNLSYMEEIDGDLIKLKRKYFKERRKAKGDANTLKALEDQYKKNYANAIIENADKPHHFFYQYSIEIKPQPSAGSTKDVSQDIRLDSGTFSFDGGFRYRYVQNDPIDKAPFGPVVSAKVKGSYQKAQLESTSTTNPEVKNTEFYMLSTEAAVGYWLKAAFVGYKYIFNTTSGDDSEVTKEINRSSVHKLTALFNVNQAYRQAMESTDTKADSSPYLLEIDYTGGKNKFGDGTLSFSIVKQFNFF